MIGAAMTILHNLDTVVDLICQHAGPDIRLAAPLGLGKPHRLLNALYDRIKTQPDTHLTLFTALSLNPPQGNSQLERRFLQPFTDRLYGADFPALHYAQDRQQRQLPANVRVIEFYMQSGALLDIGSAQQDYDSINYTRVARALANRQLNVVVQKIAANGSGRYSLSCNTDLTQDLLDQITATGEKRPLVIGEIDPQLPFIDGTAAVPEDFFDLVVQPPAPYPPLFALPRQPVADADYAIGFYASTLLRDGGTIQIGIGALADALAHALILRHTRNQTYRQILEALQPGLTTHPLVTEIGGVAPFATGLYGCSEMINEGFRALVEQGVIRRRVVESVALQRKLNEGTASPDELAQAEREGQYLHGAFYLGSPAFYEWISQQAQAANTLGMQRISLINEISGSDFERERLQRQQARFFNTCMMASVLGGAASETLPDGRVVSGVGGQYNFVSMGHLLPGARSILMLRASRQQGELRRSNILYAIENLTIPRHLRDIYITEYGMADLRDATDADCIRAMLQITDQAFVAELGQKAVQHHKLPASDPALIGLASNTPVQLARALLPFRRQGILPDYPLGSDFTPVEQQLVRALGWLKQRTASRRDKAVTLLDTAWDHARDLIAARPEQPDTSDALARMALDQPDTLEEKLLAEMLEKALRETA